MTRTSLPTADTVTYAFQTALVALMSMLSTAMVLVSDAPSIAYFAAGGSWVAVATAVREVQLRGRRIVQPETATPLARTLVPGAATFDAWVTPDLRVFFGESRDITSGVQLRG
jgi:hypothetical protein